MQNGSYVSFSLNTANKEQTILSFFDPWQIEGNMTVNIGFANSSREDYYILMDVGAYGTMPENWNETNILVKGANYNQLVWQDGYLYLNYSGGEIPHIQPYIWQGSESQVWDATTQNWQHEDNAVVYKDNVMVEFRGAKAGEVVLNGNHAARSVLVNSNEDYTFTGEGKLTGITRLTKQGEGALTISTANDYSGGTRLEGGTLVAGNAASLGSADLELVKGTLDLNGNTIGNTIYVSEDAEVTAKNGITTGELVFGKVKSYTADNFRAFSDSMVMTGDGNFSVADFIHLRVTENRGESYTGGYIGTSSIRISSMEKVTFEDSEVTLSNVDVYGGLIYAEGDINLLDNQEINVINNVVSSTGYLYGGMIKAAELTISGKGNVRFDNNEIGATYDLSGGVINAWKLTVTGHERFSLSDNEIITTSSYRSLNGGGINSSHACFYDNDIVDMSGNRTIHSGNSYGGALYASSIVEICNNSIVRLCDNTIESTEKNALGGALIQYSSGEVSIAGNGVVSITGNKAIAANEVKGGAIYGNGSVQIANNDSVLLRGNYEQTGSDYRLRSIYAGGNLELTAKTGQNISVYDSVYAVGNLTLNANKAGGEILLSGVHTEADLLTAKNGVAGTVQEITNSRTNTVVGTTTLGGGTLSLEHGAILQTGGFTATAGSDAMVRLDNAVLNSSGYDVNFGSGTILSVGGTNTLTAANLNTGSGSILNIDVRDKNSNLTALALNGNLNLDALEFSVQNADVLAAGKYKLISLGSDSHFDVGSWETVVNSVSGVDADNLSWENGTLYYTSKNTWVISKTQDAVILEAPEAGSDIVIGNGVEVELGVCLQGHMGCDNPKHGGRPGNPGQGHDHLKPGNNGNNGNGNGNGNGNNGNGNGNKKDHGHGSIVIVEGSAYIKNRGDFEGLLEFRGTQEEERHFYTENDLGVEYITVFTDVDAESHMHIAEGKTVSAEGIVGDGKLEMHGAGRMVLNGHDADESSTLYYGTLGVNEGAVRVENDSQAYVAHTEVRGAETNAGMEVGRGATMTGESLSVSGENATLHNDGSIAMTEGISVDGGTVKGSGTFSGLTLNGGTLVIGNSPGLQSYTEDLVLGSGDAIFSVGGFEMATATTSGWGEAVYSSVAMGGNTLTIGEGVTITLAFGGSALEDILLSTSETPLTFTLTLATNVDALDVADLNSLVGMTEFRITDELEGLTYLTRELAGLSLDEYVSDVHYSFADGALMLSGSVAVNGNITIPEPTTATLSLLALTMLASRRRRRYGAAEPQRKSA